MIRLEIEDIIDFELIGLVCGAKEYKLAWLVNHILGVKFCKSADIQIEFVNNEMLLISNFTYETENTTLRLLKNKAYLVSELQKPFLLPELKEFDYFLLIEDSTDTIFAEDVANILKEIEQISFVQQIDLSLVKSRDNLIFY